MTPRTLNCTLERKTLQNGIATNSVYDGIRRMHSLETQTNNGDRVVGFEHPLCVH